MQDRRQHHGVRRSRVQLLQRLGDFLVKCGHHPVQHVREIEQYLLALIRHCQPFARMLLCLPSGGDLHSDAAPDVACSVWSEGRVEPVEQQLRDPLLLAQQRASDRLGGVRCEHRLDAQAPEQLQHLSKTQPPGLERCERVRDSAGLGPLTVVDEVLSAAPDAMHFLGQIHRLEPG